MYSFVVEYYDFSCVDISYILCSDCFERTALRCYDVGIGRRYAVTKRSETVRVSGRYKFRGRHKHKRISSLYLVENSAQSLFGRRCGKSLFCDEISYYLRIAGRMENRSRHLEFFSEIVGIGKISVVSDRNSALAVIYFYRLTVVAVCCSRRAVTHVSDSYLTLRQTCHDVLCKDFVDESQILVRTENSVIVDDYAATLLSSVLKRIQAVIYVFCNIARCGCENTEYAALLIDFTLHILSSVLLSLILLTFPIFLCLIRIE